MYTNFNDFLNAISTICGVDFSDAPKATKDRARAAFAEYAVAIANGNSGAWGRAVEICSRLPRSVKKTVSTQNRADAYAKINGRRVAVEIKTNGGRVDKIKAKYIVYSVAINNKTGNKTIPARIMRTEDFLEMLRAYGALKTIAHNGVADGVGVQCNSRKLWRFLETFGAGTPWVCFDYYPDSEYNTDDFDGYNA